MNDMSASTPNSLTLRQAAAAILLNVGQVLKLRANGGKFFDPSFPKMIHGCFVESEILAWNKSKEDKAARISSTPEGDQNATN